MSEPVDGAGGGTGDSESGLTARWATFGYLFALYFILGGAETMMSPLFPLVEPDLDITESDLAAILDVGPLGSSSSSRITPETLPPPILMTKRALYAQYPHQFRVGWGSRC